VVKTYRQRRRAEIIDLIDQHVLSKQEPAKAAALLNECNSLLMHKGRPFDTPTERTIKHTSFLIDLIKTVKEHPKAITLARVAARLKYKDESSVKRRFKGAKSLLDPQPKDWPAFVQLCAQGAFDSWLVKQSNEVIEVTN
jgi:hypothetical protein